MITFVTALYPEAKGLIKHFGLKKQNRTIPFDVFVNEEAGVRLLLTGTGSIAAASAVSALLATQFYEKDIWINIGSCAKASAIYEDAFFVCSKLTEQVTGRTFYPDMMLGLFYDQMEQIQKATIVTVPTVLTSTSNDILLQTEQTEELQPVIYDMEATAIYQAAIGYLAPHQLIFLKVASDAAKGEQVTPAFLEQKMQVFYDYLLADEELLEKLDRYASFGQDRFAEQFPDARIEQMAEAFQCSETMKHELRACLRYAFLEDMDIKSVYQSLFDLGTMPAKDRKTGKKCLNELTRLLLNGEHGSESVTFDRKQYGLTAPFTRIYIEEDILKEPRTREILSQFPQAEKILIRHYKDVFSRKKQSIAMQDASKALILARKTGNLVYEGAKVCQSFGNTYFYYTSCIMNCVYDCAYCYLKGMYPSGNLVLFINLEDIFAEVEALLEKHPVYLCVSYDTDLFALEHLTGYVKKWIAFAKLHENLRIEIRTKCGRMDLWDLYDASSNVIFAFTLSPESVVSRYEHGAATLQARLDSLMKAYEKGFQVRLCFDPMVLCPDWQVAYEIMFNEVEKKVDFDRILDVSIGSFRISEDYLKKMRKAYPNEAVVQYPYLNQNGVYQYPQELLNEMEQFMEKRLLQHVEESKIFRWK